MVAVAARRGITPPQLQPSSELTGKVTCKMQDIWLANKFEPWLLIGIVREFTRVADDNLERRLLAQFIDQCFFCLNSGGGGEKTAMY